MPVVTDILKMSPPASGYLLPVHAYYDADWYATEMSHLFGRTWQWVGVVGDLPEVGSFFTTTVGVEPVLVTRTGPDRLAAYVNMCRHRGMALACGAGSVAGAFRCPYHWWEFDLDGNLTKVPQRKTEFADIDASALGLFPLQVDVWEGQIFVYVGGGGASSLGEYLADFPANIAPYPYADIPELFRERIPVAANWKLMVENHIDILHLWYLHPWLPQVYDNAGYWHRWCGPHWASLEWIRDGLPTPPPLFHEIPEIEPAERRAIRANLLFPNTTFNSHGDAYSVYRIVPTGPETCELDYRVFATGSDDIDAARDFFLKVVQEDVSAAEQMQRTMHSPHWKVGALATRWEAPIPEFQRNVLALLP